VAGLILTQPARIPPLAAASSSDRWGPAIFLTVAAIALGGALQVNNGQLAGWAIVLLSVALVAGVAALLLPALPALERHGATALHATLGAGLLAQFAQLFTRAPGLDATEPTLQLGPWYAALALAAIGVTLALLPRRWAGLPWLGLVAIVFLWLGAWMLIHLPRPDIDVYVFQWESGEAFLHGHNPYTVTFLNIYGPESSYYAPQLEDGPWLNFGFPYPPLSLLLVLPGAIFNDFRFAQLAALALTALLLTRATAGPIGIGAAALFLFTPRVFFVLHQGWTEPFVVLLLAATVVCALRAPRWVWLPLGLWLATKQYLVIAVPLTLLLLPRPWSWRDLWRLWWRAGVVALVVSLPLALWNLPAFVRSVITLQLYQPFRHDALSYVAWFARDAASYPPTWLALPAVLPALALVLWRAARTPAGFATAVAFVFLVFLATNKQAFCNYYFFVIGALCCAIAATRPAAGADATGDG
jgi:hypothetical protein